MHELRIKFRLTFNGAETNWSPQRWVLVLIHFFLSPVCKKISTHSYPRPDHDTIMLTRLLTCSTYECFEQRLVSPSSCLRGWHSVMLKAELSGCNVASSSGCILVVFPFKYCKLNVTLWIFQQGSPLDSGAGEVTHRNARANTQRSIA